MDHYLDSFSEKDSAISTIKDVICILSNGGFRLHKWIANTREILLSLPASEVSSKIVNLELDEIPIERALRLLWNPLNNLLQINAVNKTLPTSKRGVLSFISSIFDSLGMLAPATLEPKLIIQEIWKRKLDWDEELTPDLKHRWNDGKATLHKLPSIEIPRWYGFNFLQESALEFHVFADALSCAYGAVTYLRFQSNSELKCSFVIGKSRIAPIKENLLSIPKLELQAAVTASRIKVKIMEELKETVTSVFLWSDSKTILNYLHNDHSNFGVYVTHRVSEILNSTNIEHYQIKCFRRCNSLHTIP